MKYRHLLIVATIAFGMVACNQTNPQSNSPQVLGTLELSINHSLQAAKFRPVGKLASQAVITESQIVITPTGVATVVVESNAPRNFDYVSRDFTITNNTGATLNNLTLVALAKTGNLGGLNTETAIKSATAFNGTATSDANASLARPTHAMTASVGNIIVDDATNKSRASFQALTAAEATTIRNDSNFVSQVTSGTVLEYGFVATDNAQTSRSIPNGATGRFTVAMRFPKGTGAGTYNFVMTFVVATMPANRVTRSPEESTTNANTRATAIGNATDKVLIDDPTVITTPPTGYTVRSNLKIGVGASQTLLKNAAKLVIARVYTSGFAGATYTFGNDFVEIFNAGEFSATLSGKSIQAANATGNLGTDALPRVNTFDLSGLGIVAPGRYKLVVVTNANAPQLVGDNTTAWSGDLQNITGGKVALVAQTTALGCGGTSPACNTAQDNLIVDLLGYGTNSAPSKFEGTAFTYSSSPIGTEAMTRNSSCTDSNVNSADFAKTTISSTSPRSDSTPAFICP